MERELSRLTIITKDKAQVTMESLYQDLERRIVASPPGPGGSTLPGHL